MQVAAPPGDPRLFVVEQAGRIQVLSAGGTIAARPFLDVSAETLSGGERGLLGLAFAPDYATTGQFFIYLTAREPEGELQVRRYTVSATDPDRANPGGVTILRQAHDLHVNHNGGGLRFGPDGQLWVAMGDGGGSNDPERNAQDRSTLLGKLLRVGRDGAPSAGNPYLGATDGSRPEIWHSGLRNPFRFSFDRATGDLVVADVGQDAREEVDVAPWAEGLRPGANWGWPCMEGTLVNAAVAPCTAPGALPPAVETDHAADGAVAIAGGVVVRDPGVPALAGRYLFGDIAWDELRSADLASGASRTEGALRLPSVVSVDEDGCGRVVVTSFGGRVARLVDGTPSACGQVPPASYGPRGCGLQVALPAKRRRARLLRRGVRVALQPRSACTVELRIRAGSAFGPARRVTLVAGERRALRLRVGAARRGLRRHLSVRLVVTAGTRTVVRHERMRVV